MLVCEHLLLSTVMLCGQAGPHPASKRLPVGTTSRGEGANPMWTSNPRVPCGQSTQPASSGSQNWELMSAPGNTPKEGCVLTGGMSPTLLSRSSSKAF